MHAKKDFGGIASCDTFLEQYSGSSWMHVGEPGQVKNVSVHDYPQIGLLIMLRDLFHRVHLAARRGGHALLMIWCVKKQTEGDWTDRVGTARTGSRSGMLQSGLSWYRIS